MQGVCLSVSFVFFFFLNIFTTVNVLNQYRMSCLKLLKSQNSTFAQIAVQSCRLKSACCSLYSSMTSCCYMYCSNQGYIKNVLNLDQCLSYVATCFLTEQCKYYYEVWLSCNEFCFPMLLFSLLMDFLLVLSRANFRNKCIYLVFQNKKNVKRNF